MPEFTDKRPRGKPARPRRSGVALIAVAACGLAAVPASAAAPGAYRAGAAWSSAAPWSGVWRSALTPPAMFAKAPARGVNYGGTTSQADPFVIVLSKNGKRVVRIIDMWRASCQSVVYAHYNWIGNSAARNISISANGGFSGNEAGSEPLDTTHTIAVAQIVSGKVNGKKITGSLEAHVVVLDVAGAVVDHCDLTTKFSLTSAKGTEFAGSTSRGAPAAVELTASRKKVNHFHIGWRATCTPQGGFQIGDFLTNFPITAGRFGASFSQNFTEPSGETETYAYTVSGKITGATASGSFRAKATFREAGGNTIGSCDLGSVSWRAASG